jgi:hypothetical protein
MKKIGGVLVPQVLDRIWHITFFRMVKRKRLNAPLLYLARELEP